MTSTKWAPNLAISSAFKSQDYASSFTISYFAVENDTMMGYYSSFLNSFDNPNRDLRCIILREKDVIKMG